jgi:peptidoglycan/xylan/chitin deacetylase (PgdA/CDA1 family)
MRAGTARVWLCALMLAAVSSGCRADDLWGIVVDRDPSVVYSFDTRDRAIALTIDDGPSAASTPSILEVLHRHGAPATFFLIGEHVPGNQGIVAAMVASGHEIANHGVHDEPAVDLGAEHFERDLLATDRILSHWQKPVWFRPGSGWYEDWMLEILERHGYRVALGTVYPLDTVHPFVGLSRRFILWRTSPGGIVILHDVGERGARTAEVLNELLPELARRGFRVVTLSELAALAEGPQRLLEGVQPARVAPAAQF